MSSPWSPSDPPEVLHALAALKAGRGTMRWDNSKNVDGLNFIADQFYLAKKRQLTQDELFKKCLQKMHAHLSASRTVKLADKELYEPSLRGKTPWSIEFQWSPPDIPVYVCWVNTGTFGLERIHVVSIHPSDFK